MRQNRFVTLRAGGGFRHPDSIVGTPRAPFGLGFLLFGYSHNLSSTSLRPTTEIEISRIDDCRL